MLVLTLQFLIQTLRDHLQASKAHIKGLSLSMINKSAGWTTDSTFAKFYNKIVHENFGMLIINTEQT